MGNVNQRAATSSGLSPVFQTAGQNRRRWDQYGLPAAGAPFVKFAPESPMWLPAARRAGASTQFQSQLNRPCYCPTKRCPAQFPCPKYPSCPVSKAGAKKATMAAAAKGKPTGPGPRGEFPCRTKLTKGVVKKRLNQRVENEKRAAKKQKKLRPCESIRWDEARNGELCDQFYGVQPSSFRTQLAMGAAGGGVAGALGLGAAGLMAASDAPLVKNAGKAAQQKAVVEAAEAAKAAQTASLNRAARLQAVASSTADNAVKANLMTNATALKQGSAFSASEVVPNAAKFAASKKTAEQKMTALFGESGEALAKQKAKAVEFTADATKAVDATADAAKAAKAGGKPVGAKITKGSRLRRVRYGMKNTLTGIGKRVGFTGGRVSARAAAVSRAFAKKFPATAKGLSKVVPKKFVGIGAAALGGIVLAGGSMGTGAAIAGVYGKALGEKHQDLYQCEAKPL